MVGRKDPRLRELVVAHHATLHEVQSVRPSSGVLSHCPTSVMATATVGFLCSAPDLAAGSATPGPPFTHAAYATDARALAPTPFDALIT